MECGLRLKITNMARIYRKESGWDIMQTWDQQTNELHSMNASHKNNALFSKIIIRVYFDTYPEAKHIFKSAIKLKTHLRNSLPSRNSVQINFKYNLGILPYMQ